MRLYPSFRFAMGGHDFFVTKMNATEIDETVKFASDLFQGKTLSEAIQRNLKVNRASNEIAFYWRESKARFFNAIVIAAWEGNAKFFPVESLVTGADLTDSLLEDERMHDSFGILKFDGTEKYYALDGQHRVMAIKLMLNQPDTNPPPDGFKDDEFTVIIVPTAEGEGVDQFRMRYRRMFSALNRYAKPTDMATNYVMDEDDVFAIITRQLITDHPFFKWGDNDWQNERIKTDAGKNLKTGDAYFTQIEVLYEMTEKMLTSALRSNKILAAPTQFKHVRPADDKIESWYDEVALIWDVLLEIIPELNRDPVDMRIHNPGPGDEEKSDHLWFWPIGQQLVAPVVRTLIDHSAVPLDADSYTPLNHDHVLEALAILGRIDWNLHALPWRHLLLVTEGDGTWRMRSEGRTEALKVARQLLFWITNIADYGDVGVSELRARWEFILYQMGDDVEDVDTMWKQIKKIKVLAAGGRL